MDTEKWQNSICTSFIWYPYIHNIRIEDWWNWTRLTDIRYGEGVVILIRRLILQMTYTNTGLPKAIFNLKKKTLLLSFVSSTWICISHTIVTFLLPMWYAYLLNLRHKASSFCHKLLATLRFHLVDFCFHIRVPSWLFSPVVWPPPLLSSFLSLLPVFFSLLLSV